MRIKNFSDVLNKSRLKLESCNLQLNNTFGSKKYEPVILQNNETNFEFIARISKTHGSRLWIIDTLSEFELCLDECINTTARKITNKQINSIRRIKNKKHSKIFLQSEIYFKFGRAVTIEFENLTEYVIIGFRSWLENQVWIHYLSPYKQKIGRYYIPSR